MRNTETITYTIDGYERHGYKFTRVTVRRMREEKVAELLEGAIDNKAGYGTADAARGQEARYRALQERGVESIYDSLCVSGLHLSIEWQHYEADGFCDPHFPELGRGFGEIETAMRFLRKIGGRIEKAVAARRNREAPVDGYKYSPHRVSSHTFSSPHDFVDALARMRGSVQVARDRSSETWLATEAKICAAKAA